MNIVPIEKQSKKKQREFYNSQRQTNGMNTGTRDMGKSKKDKFADILEKEIKEYKQRGVNMLEKVKEYFEKEYNSTKRAIENHYSFATPKQFVERSITDCLAITQFAQTLGVSYEDVAPVYEEIKERLENLLTD